jgi:translation initiation factor IF-3
MQTQKALERAKEDGLDLVIITEGANPPIAKILDYNKFLYEENKKSSAAKSKSKKSELKEFWVGPHIGEGDLNVRIERAREFIQDGNRVLFAIKMRGRERAFPEVALEKVEQFAKGLAEVARAESDPKSMAGEVKVIFVKK